MDVDSVVGQTSVENSDFSKFYVRDKLLSLNLANSDLDESSANDKISGSKGSSLHGLSHEDTVKEFNDNTDLSMSSLAKSCGTERKLQDKMASGKVVKHSGENGGQCYATLFKRPHKNKVHNDIENDSD